MAEPTTKELLITLVGDVKHIKDKQDKMKLKQDDMDLRFNNIETELIGTSMDPERGMIPRCSDCKQPTIHFTKYIGRSFTKYTSQSHVFEFGNRFIFFRFFVPRRDSSFYDRFYCIVC